MREPTITVQFHGLKDNNLDGETVGVVLPLSTKIQDIPGLLSAKYDGYKGFDVIKLRGSTEPLQKRTYQARPDILTVVHGESQYDTSTALYINEDETLVSFYNKVYCKQPTKAEVKGRSAVEEVKGNMNRIMVDGLVDIRFQRTVRVPDDGGTYNLPPGLGDFPIFDVCDYERAFSQEMVEKGGVFIPMYQREALWISFTTPYSAAPIPYAIKVYLGGVNGISGEPMIPNMAADLKQSSASKTQDYIVVPPQKWLDGIATSPGKVKQFVAMPFGSGYSVEQQVTGMEVVGGLQLEIIPMYEQDVAFSKEHHFNSMKAEMDIFATPRVLGIRVGEVVCMKKKEMESQKDTDLSDLVEDPKNPVELHLDIHQTFSGKIKVGVAEKGTFVSLNVNSTSPFDIIGEKLQEQTGLSPQDRGLSINGFIVSSWEDIAQHIPHATWRTGGEVGTLEWSQCWDLGDSYTIDCGDDGKVVINVNPDEPISNMKQKIKRKASIIVEDQRLSSNGKVFDDTKRLSDYGITPRDQIRLRRMITIYLVPDHDSKEPIRLDISTSDTVYEARKHLADTLKRSADERYFRIGDKRLDLNHTLGSYNIKDGDRLIYYVDFMHLRGGCAIMNKEIMSVAAGGTIKQHILEDEYNPQIWDIGKAKLINIQIVNSTAFEGITGMMAPATPVSFQAYAKLGFPFFDIYKEAPSKISGAFSGVKTIEELDSGLERTKACEICRRKQADCVIRPCNHYICHECSGKATGVNSASKCQVCQKPSRAVVGVSAPVGKVPEKFTMPVVMLDIKDNRTKFQSIVKMGPETVVMKVGSTKFPRGRS